MLGFLTLRRIVKPIRALERSVKAIAGGDYAKPVPFVSAPDETGGLARSIDVLKQGAAAMDEQRWVKTNVSRLTGELQGAASLEEFGRRLLSEPYRYWRRRRVLRRRRSREQLRRVAAHGLADSSAPPAPSDSAKGWSGARRSERSSRSPTFLAGTFVLPPAWARLSWPR